MVSVKIPYPVQSFLFYTGKYLHDYQVERDSTAGNICLALSESNQLKLFLIRNSWLSRLYLVQIKRIALVLQYRNYVRG